MTGNLIKDMVLMSRGIMIMEDEPTEQSEQVCNGDCQTCKKCGEDV
jgi:hypothetical protein